MKFINLRAPYMIFIFWLFCVSLSGVIFGFWKVLKMVLEWECVTLGGGVYLVKFIHLRAPFMSFGFLEVFQGPFIG